MVTKFSTLQGLSVLQFTFCCKSAKPPTCNRVTCLFKLTEEAYRRFLVWTCRALTAHPSSLPRTPCAAVWTQQIVSLLFEVLPSTLTVLILCFSGTTNACLEFTELSLKDSFLDIFKPKIKVELLLFTRGGINCAQPLFMRDFTLNNNFNVTKKTVWIVHGYRPLGTNPVWLHKFVNSLLSLEDVNIVVVDWNQGATTLLYQRAVKRCWKVATILREYIKKMMKLGISLQSFHFIGVSLGAHISGYVGSIFKGRIGRITVIQNNFNRLVMENVITSRESIMENDKLMMENNRFVPRGEYIPMKNKEDLGKNRGPTNRGIDPAGPGFNNAPIKMRLDYTDAQFVDIIHSDAYGLGISHSIGHLDFYPNGGRNQPGCPTSIFAGFTYIKCNHQRAVFIFISSLATECNITAYPCNSYQEYKNGKCTNCEDFGLNLCPTTGYYADHWKNDIIKRHHPQLEAYFDTSPKEPFCLYQYALDIVTVNEIQKQGIFEIKLKDKYGTIEASKIKHNKRTFPAYSETRILAGFYNDFKEISQIILKYIPYHVLFKCRSCQYQIHHIRLSSLYFPERPELCEEEILLIENMEIKLHPHFCDK
ncbi:lipase member I-like [Sarcophilus harrisii]